MQQVIAQAAGIVAAAGGQPQLLDNADYDATIGRERREEMENVIELLQPVLGAVGQGEAVRVRELIERSAPTLMDRTDEAIRLVGARKPQLMRAILAVFNPRVGFGANASSLEVTDCAYVGVQSIESPLHILLRRYVDDDPRFTAVLDGQEDFPVIGEE